MIICGLDVGTTGCKLTSYDEKGNFVCNFYQEYDVRRQNGEHEIDATVIWEAVCRVIRQTAQSYPIDAIGVTTFGESFVALDENDVPLLPAMLYTDPRGTEECRKLCERMDEARITHICGVKPHSMYSLPKLMWIKSNRPEIYAKIKRVLLMEDFIVYMLSGKACLDYSLAARTMALDIRRKCWSEEIFAAADIDMALFSTPVPAAHLAGTIKAEIAEALGVSPSVRIVNGSHDQVAAAVGAGILEVGNAVDGTGTVECVTPMFDHVPENADLYEQGYSVVPYIFDGTYVCYALSFTGGAVLKWFKNNLSANRSYAELDAAVKDVPTGILVLPHFSGAANPYMDNGSKAAFVGLTLEHTGEDLYKALMEGVTYEIMTNIEHLESFGITPKRLFATGGGATSDVWLQIKADILGRPITALAAKEVGACGTCMMVGTALGLYTDLAEARTHFVKEGKTFLPNPENANKYKQFYQAYKNIYDAVRPIVKEAYDE